MKTKSEDEPLAVSLKRAAALLDRDPEVLRRTLVKAGEFTVNRSKGATNGSKIFIPFDEVKVYAEQGLDALRQYRARNKRKGKRS